MTSLAGVGVAVTRPGEGPGRLGELIRAARGSVIHWPCIRFAPPEDPDRLRAAARSDAYDWVVLTSPRAARHWLAAVRDDSAGPGDSAGPEWPRRSPAIAVVGPGTASVVRDAGGRVALVAREHSASGVVAAMRGSGELAGRRVLFPCANLAADTVADGLSALGASVDRVIAYRTLPAPPDTDEVRNAVEGGRVQVALFASGSAVDAFLAPFPADGFDPRHRLAAAAIGPTTGDALSRAGWPATVAGEATLEGLVAAAARAAEGLVLRDGSVT